ncbi:MAG: LacI family transcriptional regulator [Ignavibacteriae bacterium HGW-Ignavibacteriae-4]|jgi:DNA-binding LacI/PurR family transcriptional regulator|nr:MAG: LacI family transcriptional regulator [Ignavibacteriae bacterium HGW-Ignavibacteriae-4]
MGHRITVKQIADELGVSMMTVSRALNDSPNIEAKTREKVLATAKKMGYIQNHIARSLVQRKTNTIGVVVPEITHSFFPEVIRGVEEVTYANNYQLILTHSAENAKREINAIDTLASKRVDGILISTAESAKSSKKYKQIMEMGMYIVFFDRCVHNIGASCVRIEDEKSSYKITEHLISYGYTKIAHLSGPTSVSIGQTRLNGFKKALKKNNIDLNKKYIVESGFHEDGGYSAMKKILDLPKKEWPRAIVAVNDPAAFGAMKAILEVGLKVPEDIAIVGFSDDIRSELMPAPLTTMRQPAYQIGKKAAEKLIKHIQNKDEIVEDIIIDSELIIRKSCGIYK